jgi:hypothetical protein
MSSSTPAGFAPVLPVSMMTRTLLGDAARGRLEYLRIALRVDDPGAVLADRTLTVGPGATVDVVAERASPMGLGRVSYAPGLRGLRKVVGDLITYRFFVPADTQAGAIYSINAQGVDGRRAFNFFLRVT